MPAVTPYPQTAIAKGFDPLSGSGAPIGKSCLIRIYPPGTGEGLIDLPLGRFIIGRGVDCGLDLCDPAVSRRHAYIEPRAGNYVLVDMNSTNGTYVNDELVERRFLEAGDLIRIGSNIVKFLSNDHIEAQYHETIYSMMITDGLTGIHNKRYLLESLDRELVRSRRHTRPLSLVMLDIDHFKQINDTYGHVVGDEVLRQLCQRIRGTIRKDEVFARYGGEEFAVVLPESTKQTARCIAERLRSIVANDPMEIATDSVQITISLGAAQTNGESALSPEAIIAKADRKLYQAKQLGRNRVCV